MTAQHKKSIKARVLRRCLAACGLRTRLWPQVLAAMALAALFTAPVYYMNQTQRCCRKSESDTDYRINIDRRALNGGSVRLHVLLKSPEENFNEMGVPFVNIDTKNPYVPKERIVHLDLKGAPPQITYLQRIFPLIKSLGATGILIEYEDMFPYSGPLEDVTARNHYTRKDILEIVSLAENTGLKIIPLVQTFGHLEFALKRPSLVHLRENPDSPQALCPSQNASLVFIENMLSQVLEMHVNHITHLHIGCDEVFHLAECKLCTNRTSSNDGDRSKDAIFLNHVVNVAKIVKRRWPSIRLLIWDDMLRHVPDDLLSLYEIGKYVDPVVWWYTDDIYRFIPTTTWRKYSKVFQTAWTASAFKGAFGENVNVPNARRHLENNLEWLYVMAEQNKYFPQGFAGIMLTGWQRYDHFAVLCELLPAAIPSLALTLLSTTFGHVNTTLLNKFGAALGCPDDPDKLLKLNSDPFMYNSLWNCIFPGSKFFIATSKLGVAEIEANYFMEQATKRKGWLTDYNIRHKFTSADRIDTIVQQDGDLNKLLKKLIYVAEFSKAALQNITDEHTTNEFIEQKIYPLIIQMEQLSSNVVSLKKPTTWERRPLKPLLDMSRFGLTTDDLFPV